MYMNTFAMNLVLSREEEVIGCHRPAMDKLGRVTSCCLRFSRLLAENTSEGLNWECYSHH